MRGGLEGRSDVLRAAQPPGFVPVKVLVHCCSDYYSSRINWEKAYTELKNYREDLPLLTLAEGQFVKYEKIFTP